jgi:hypothetical protein
VQDLRGVPSEPVSSDARPIVDADASTDSVFDNLLQDLTYAEPTGAHAWASFDNKV